MTFILLLLTSYLIGSIPTAYLFGRWFKGIDIRQHGSGNVGATNAFRVLGKGPGICVLLVDIVKGLIPTAILADQFGFVSDMHRVLLGLAVVAGHNWTVFLDFKGGKGIATSLGVLIGLTLRIALIRPVLAITVFTWLVVFLVFGYVSLASILAAIMLPIIMVTYNLPLTITSLGIIFCGFVIWRHRPNIKRLLAGSESRVDFPFKKRK
jgi:acyl phosphate:glycerol-3-phosphate acyltransferase